MLLYSLMYSSMLIFWAGLISFIWSMIFLSCDLAGFSFKISINCGVPTVSGRLAEIDPLVWINLPGYQTRCCVDAEQS